MATPVNTQQKTLQWMVDIMRANPNAHPDWVIKQVVRRCPDDANSCNEIYQQARRMVGAAYRAAPVSYQPAARLQGTPPQPPTKPPVTTLEEVTVVGDPNVPDARSDTAANPFTLQLTQEPLNSSQPLPTSSQAGGTLPPLSDLSF